MTLVMQVKWATRVEREIVAEASIVVSCTGYNLIKVLETTTSDMLYLVHFLCDARNGIEIL